jgi:uncharacterized protein YjbI with pentapeptide repeats
LANSEPQNASNSAADFVAAIKAHENYVLRRPNGKRADLRFINAPGINLSGRRLDDVELSGADLKGANLKGVNFNRASLSCTNLQNANLSGASLNRTDLRGARIQGASFEFAEMDGADFRQSTIAFTDKNSKWTVLGRDQNNMTTVSFANCSLKGAKMNNANLKDANFDGALLNGASFGGATLGNASFEGAVLIGVNLSELRVPKENLKSCVTDPGPEQTARLPKFIAALDNAQRWAETGGREGLAANLEGEDIRLLAQMMKNRKLTGIKCSKTLAVDANFSGCELQAANFDGADLRGALFVGADLRGASFRGANLAHANFSQANLLSLDLKSGDSLTTKFDGAVLDRANFHESQRDPVAA